MKSVSVETTNGGHYTYDNVERIQDGTDFRCIIVKNPDGSNEYHSFAIKRIVRISQVDMPGVSE